MGDHSHHNNHRHSTSNHNNSHSNRHSQQHQNNPNQHQHSHQNRPQPHMVRQYERPVGPEKPSKFSQMKEKFQNKFSEKVPTREQIEQLKVKAEHAKYDADVTVNKARKAKAERENPSGWRRLFVATQSQPQRSARSGVRGTRRPTASQYYGGRGRGPPQMGDSMLIGPGSFSGNNLMFDPSGGQVGDNMLSFESNGKNVENDMLSFKPISPGPSGKKVGKTKKSESMGMTFGEGATKMFTF
jgi:hypothetical protein